MSTPVTSPSTLRLSAIAALLAAIFFARTAPAQTPSQEFWSQPDSAIAFFVFDPRALGQTPDPTVLALQAGVRALIENCVSIEGGGLTVPGDLLATGVLGANPYRVCLLDLATELPAGPIAPDRSVQISRIALVIEVKAKPPHDTLIEVLRGAVSRDHAARHAPPAAETLIDLVSRQRATRSAAGGDPDWREVTWCSTSDSLLVGIGHGALDRWFAAPTPASEPLSEYNAIRTEVFHRRESTAPLLDAGVDLDALRRLFPDQFLSGRLGRLAQAWHVPNARTLMLIARLSSASRSDAPPLVCADIGWSARSQPPGTVHSTPLSESAWPEAIQTPRPGLDARYALVLKADWEGWVPLALETWVALTPRATAAPLVAKLKWMRAHGKALDRLTDRAGPWVQVCGPNPAVPPFSTSFSAAPATGDTLDADLREVFGFISGAIKPDAAKRAWTLNLEDVPPPLNQFAWTAPKQSDLFLGSWDPVTLGAVKPAR